MALKPHLPKAKQPIARIGERIKRLYLAEWMESRDPPVKQAELARETGIDKSLISRWINDGIVPGDRHLQTLANFFAQEEGADPEMMLRHPEDEWLTRRLRQADADEKRRMRQLLEAVFPQRA